jgi:hypothetical protein
MHTCARPFNAAIASVSAPPGQRATDAATPSIMVPAPSAHVMCTSSSSIQAPRRCVFLRARRSRLASPSARHARRPNLRQHPNARLTVHVSTHPVIMWSVLVGMSWHAWQQLRYRCQFPLSCNWSCEQRKAVTQIFCSITSALAIGDCSKSPGSGISNGQIDANWLWKEGTTGI